MSFLCLQPCTCNKDNKYVTFDARTCCPVAAVSVLLLIKFRPFFCLVFILSLSFVSCLCSLSTDLVVLKLNRLNFSPVCFQFCLLFVYILSLSSDLVGLKLNQLNFIASMCVLLK